MRDSIKELIQNTLNQLKKDGKISLEQDIEIQVERARDRNHGDFASNIAMILAKKAKMNPRELAQMILEALPSDEFVAKVELAGPGFINFFLTQAAMNRAVSDILQAGDRYGEANIGQGKKVMVEFVSANPTGPLHVGHGRGAAYGSAVSDLLAAVGFDVHREYYVNDAGRQMDILATSVYLRYLQQHDVELRFPDNGYKGDYILDIAKNVAATYRSEFVKTVNDVFKDVPADEEQGGDKEKHIDALIENTKQLLGRDHFDIILGVALNDILADIREDLDGFHVHMQQWFSERSLLTDDSLEKGIALLKEKELIYEQDGAWWFKSSEFGDEKDRVVLRANGQHTYFASDLFYHINKYNRGFELLLDVWGADHHGYVARMKAGLKGLDHDSEQFKVLLVQFATLYRDGNKVQMSTRSGSFVTLRELREEVGNDAARFFYVMRKCEQHMDFDLDLAKSKSNENPVYYIQYAHARVCSVIRQMQERGIKHDLALGEEHLHLLAEDAEQVLLNKLARYPETLQAAAINYEPHALANYLKELAGDFHAYYNSHQFLIEDVNLRHARLSLILAVRQVIKNGLTLLSVSTPETM